MFLLSCQFSSLSLDLPLTCQTPPLTTSCFSNDANTKDRAEHMWSILNWSTHILKGQLFQYWIGYDGSIWSQMSS
jgi:hypothetical protein